MTIAEVSAKIDLRINKSASGDYDNIWRYVKQEAYTKATNDLIRRVFHGKNDTKEGSEETTIRVDDLQVLLKRESLSVRDKGYFSESDKLPTDYLYFNRITPIVSKLSCQSVQMASHLREESNVDMLIDTPSFEFEETFHTLINNKVNIYHNKQFIVEKVILTYFRKPKAYDFKKLDTVIEFKDDVCEIIVDEACKIIASDIESLNPKQLAQERVENNV